MANQGADRRIVLEMLAKAAVASQFTGFSRWTFAKAAAPELTGKYRPQFFSELELQTIDTLSELIIPADVTPGASAAGVSEFIDFMAAHGEMEIREPLRKGLAALDEKSTDQYSKAFTKLTPSQQIAVLSVIAKRDSKLYSFFRLIRRYTTMGYYTSKIGMEALDCPQLRFYPQSPECPHTGDPEHRHLPPPVF